MTDAIRSFDTLLVANRGEIARRVARTAREMGLRVVAVYVDADAGAPFVREADLAVRLPGTYLDADAIVEAARATGAGAVHPGYGFLSENADFARAVEAAGLAFVGPSAEAIARMGDKLAARSLAESCGVPTLPGCEDPERAGAIGYPLLVKAAAGGGGKGMRVVREQGELAEAVAAARREAAWAFGDDRIFLERYVPRARHVEVQILGDHHGGLVHLGERECSIQRRHQKIVEESPSPRVDDTLRQALGEAALRLGRALGYASAGTVEFLLDDDTGEFFFLEVNTRIQVEHPVTEAVTGIDLVREQIRVARGERLGHRQEAIRFEGAAIEARLYAEDPSAGFLPATGRLVAFEPADHPAVRIDTGVETGSVVGTDFDPMLAKVIAHAPSRTEAAGRLARALERLHLGGVTTNRDFLVAVLRSPAFLAGDTTTDFIDRIAPARRREPDREEVLRAARLAALHEQAANRARASVLREVPSGFRNSRMPPQEVVFRFREERIAVRYRRERDGRFRFEDGPRATVHAADAGCLDAEIDGLRTRARITREGELALVQMPGGDLEFAVEPRFEVPGEDEVVGGTVAPMPGRVLEVRAAAGARVRAGEVLVVLEAMKMEHPIRAPQDGVVAELRVAKGDQVEAGTLLLVVEPEGGEGGS